MKRLSKVPFTLLRVSKFFGEVRIFFIHDRFNFVTFEDTITLFYNFQSEKLAWSLFPASGSTILENCGCKWPFAGEIDFDYAYKSFSCNLS